MQEPLQANILLSNILMFRANLIFIHILSILCLKKYAFSIFIFQYRVLQFIVLFWNSCENSTNIFKFFV